MFVLERFINYNKYYQRYVVIVLKQRDKKIIKILKLLLI